MINKTLIFRRVTFLFFLSWQGLIYWFSSRTAAQSGKSSGPITKAIVKLFYENEVNVSTLSQIEFFVRKSAHLILFCVLGAIIAVYLLQFKSFKRRLVFWVSLLVTAVSGIFDEVHQYFVPGRACKFFDVFVDTFGGLIGISLVILCYYFIIKKHSRIPR